MKITVTPGRKDRLLFALGQITTAKMIREDALTPDEILELVDLYPAWAVGEAVKVGDLRKYGHHLYECIQAHTIQSDWTPDITPALWKIKSAPGVIPLWTQPTGAHDAYSIGERVIWPEDGPIWESTIDANTTEPGTLIEHGYWIQINGG